MITAEPLNGIAGIRHGFFTRQGGQSTGIYQSLNCGLGSGDKVQNVTANRAQAMELAGLPKGARLHTLYQVHSATALTVREGWEDEARPEADGMATGQAGLALGIVTADCAPVLFADGEAGVVGAAHAGWRGALDGILEATIGRMVELGAQPARMIAAIGPCIAQESYEVHEDYALPFMESNADNSRFFIPGAREGRILFDLPGYIENRLKINGLTWIAGAPADTYEDAERFFSYRRSQHRGEPDYGRLLSIICLTG
ncbi:MAG: peptidoglycan editing factor PgeF [Rhodospirillales bacterium]|jgi:hypothetical protein|nr:peptidoglycan editing factor PgeF [Rhodospirillales bacterium]